MAVSKTMKFVLAFSVTLGLLIPGLILLPRGNNVSPGNDPYVPPADNENGQLANQAAWEEFTGPVAPARSGLNETLFSRNVTIDQLRVLAGQEAQTAANGTQSNSGSRYGLEDGSAVNGGAPAPSKAAGAAGTPAPVRVVEEADIVKLQGEYLYVLNAYRGLIIVNLSARDQPAVAGAAEVLGYPEEMYVSGNLAFIIVSANYGYWYGYYTRALETDSVIAPGSPVEVEIGTHIVVVNLKDKAAPRIVMSIPLTGYASESRRVGDVIYAVTNIYSWAEYGSDHSGAFVTSVDFTTPGNVRKVQSLFFNGSSSQIHASPTALFVAQPHYNEYTGFGLISSYTTKITYIDISDPHGAIKKRGSFEVIGYVEDKYQMDHYKNMFRVVSHMWGAWGRLGSSALTVLDVSNPDAITKMSILPINDAGTLMATRFAGNRAYTIHLPRSIDPLDTIDLSDPYNPKLTDVLEMPGWVTHIEVRGYKLIALGVDDSTGTQKVAVSLFDVADPYNTRLSARVSIGTGYSWSEANWEPKALTVIDEQGLVVVPFQSYEGKTGRTIEGLQLVEFDLARNLLAARGVISNTEPVRRTRAFEDRILATSDMALQVIDATDRTTPKVKSRLEFAWNVQDAARIGNSEVQLVVNDWSDGCRLRCVRAGAGDWAAPVSSIDLKLFTPQMYISGTVVYISGVEDQKMKLHAYNYSNPGAPVLSGVAGTDIVSSGKASGKMATDEYYHRYYYSPGQPVVLTGGLLTVTMQDAYYGGANGTVYLFDISGPSPRALNAVTYRTGPESGQSGYNYYYPSGMTGAGRTLYFTTWGNSLQYLGRIDLADPAKPVQLPFAEIKGNIVAVAADGSAIYTTGSYYNGQYDYGTNFNIYTPDAGGLSVKNTVQFNSSFSSAKIFGKKAYITFYTSMYHMYDAPGMKGGSARAGPTTMLVVLDLKTCTVTGTIGLDGYASVIAAGGDRLFVSGDSVVASYDISGDRPVFAGGIALRSYAQNIRPFEGGAVISEGLYGTETLEY